MQRLSSIFCCAKRNNNDKEKAKLLSNDELNHERKNSGIFKNVPEEIIAIILSFCDLNTFHIIKQVNKHFYAKVKKALPIKKNKLFLTEFSVYKNDFYYFNFKDQTEVITYIKLMPTQMNNLLDKQSPEEKKLTIIALSLQLSDLLLFLTKNKFLQFSLVRKYERKVHASSTLWVPYQQPITSLIMEKDFETMKKEPSFADTATKLLKKLRDTAFDKSEIEIRSSTWFKLNKEQNELLLVIQNIIQQLEQEVKNLTPSEPELRKQVMLS